MHTTQDLSPTDYLSRPAQALEWQSYGLPNDQLCTENAIILDRFNRFPLIIDPSGQATQFILSKYASRKIQATSFMDASFLKTLGSAVRFGTPLLIQDVETIDPILNPVLNKELQRTGGRTIIRLGNEVSPSVGQLLLVNKCVCVTNAYISPSIYIHTPSGYRFLPQVRGGDGHS